MDWTALRSEFPVTGQWTYFDHAAVAPLSGRAQRALNEWATDLATNGAAFHGKWMQRVEDVRGHFGRLLHCEPLDVAFVKNTSEGIGIVAEGLDWRRGDNVVIAEEEYPANVYPWMNLASRGVEVRPVASRDNRIHVDDLRAAIDARTRLLSISWVEFASGFRTDIGAIGALCKERGVLFFVDAIQGLGVFPLDLSQTPIDFLAADGHKWLLGPEGAGVLYVKREHLKRLHPVGVGWNSVVGAKDFTRIQFDLKPHAGRYESGSLNVAGIHALGASLELLQEIGIENIATRVLELTDELCRLVEPLQSLRVFSSRRPGEASSIVSLEVADPASLKSLLKLCRDNRILINARRGRLRVSPHFYNTSGELHKLVDVLKG